MREWILVSIEADKLIGYVMRIIDRNIAFIINIDTRTSDADIHIFSVLLIAFCSFACFFCNLSLFFSIQNICLFFKPAGLIRTMLLCMRNK